MNKDISLTALYAERIMSMASELPPFEELPHSDGSCSRHSRLCGSDVKTEVILTRSNTRKRLVDRVAMQVHACVFGQAAASLVLRYAYGRDLYELIALRESMERILHDDEVSVEHLILPELRFFQGIAPYKHRHSSVLLSFQSIECAILDAEVGAIF